MSADEVLTAEAVSFGYGPARASAASYVVEGISLRVKRDEVVCVMGPSGVGKTTLLRLIAGLEAPAEGQITRRVGSGDAGCAYLFQDLRLLPWKSARQNVELALLPKARAVHDGQSAAQRRAALAQSAVRYLDMVGLKSSAETYPRQMSGGMLQRLALARTLAMQADLMLLDEPFSSLDIANKRRLERLFLELKGSCGFAAVLVTHDVEQAVMLGDRISLLTGRPGRISTTLHNPFAPSERDLRAPEVQAYISQVERSLGEVEQ